MKRKIISALLVLIFCLGVMVPFGVSAAGERLVFDEADLLTASEEIALEQRLMEISRAYQAQMVVYTIPYLEGGDVDSYVDIVYDSMGFGYGVNRDGVLLLVCMDPREYMILSNGFAGVAIDNSLIEYIGENIVPDLSDGNYATAFHIFADTCAYHLDGYINGYPYDAGFWLIASLIIGAVVALISVLIMRSKLKSVRWQNQAANYVKPGSMTVTLQEDIYLYRTVTRTKRETESSSGSGGSARSKGGGSF